eukprot:134386_1
MQQQIQLKSACLYTVYKKMHQRLSRHINMNQKQHYNDINRSNTMNGENIQHHINYVNNIGFNHVQYGSNNINTPNNMNISNLIQMYLMYWIILLNQKMIKILTHQHRMLIQ